MSAKKTFEVECPCCKATLVVDAKLGAILSHEPPPQSRAHLELDPTGQIIVDTSRLYSWPKGGVDHFNDPGSFVNV